MPRRIDSEPPGPRRGGRVRGGLPLLLVGASCLLPSRGAAQESACASCHAGPAASVSASSHREIPAHPSLRGCETCHRTASAHARLPRPAGEREAFREERGDLARSCALCHPKRPVACSETEKGWSLERCLDCHRVHPTARSARAFPGYAGDGSCRACHAPIFQGNRGHAPRVRNADDGPHRGCEACHGPSADHRADPKVRTPVDAPGASACSRCHAADPALEGERTSPHARRRVSCMECHAPAPEPPSPGSRCLACHPSVVAQFRLPSHHRLPEGRISCVDCHDPHAGAERIGEEELRREDCVKCHAEEGGPFLFEHEGDRLRGCLSCHRPHGSPNPRLLTHSRSEDLCASCHPTPACNHLHDPGSIWRNCLRCHTAIHGSNWSHELFR
ncbi:MAG TPA: cytochrome c3 family protein [Planctomycetota bacterium]|nr:cytochrome c3 family protein [Planctomycetota bacterium]